MKKLNQILTALIVATLFLLSSCGGKDKPPKTLTPDESQKKMENIGIKLANEINAADFKDLINVIEDFSEIAESLGDVLEDHFSTRSTVNLLKRVVTKNDLKTFTGMLRPASIGAKNNYYTKYYKTFTYNENTGQWAESPNTTALMFVFRSGGKNASISASVSADYYTVTADGETIYIPKTSTLTIKHDNSDLLVHKIEVPAFSSTSNKISASISVPKANMTWTAGVDAAPNNSTMSVAVKKGAKTLISGKATTNTNGLILPGDGENLDDFIDDYEEPAIPGKTVFEMNIMDELFLRAECSSINDFYNAMEKADSDFPWVYTYEQKQIPDANCGGYRYETIYEDYRPIDYYQATKLVFEKHLKMYFSYKADMSVKEGDLYYDFSYNLRTEIWGSQCYSYKETQDNTMVILGIQFANGGKHKLEDFFTEDSFSGFISALEQLQNDFEALFNK
jgi:hypothetical protein